MPGPGRNLFSVKQAARNGIVLIFYMNTPKLETDIFTISLQELGHDLHFFSLNFDDGSDRPEQAMKAATSANLWHRLLGAPKSQEPESPKGP